MSSNSLRNVLSVVFSYIPFYLLIYLASLGLSCGTQNRVPWPWIEPWPPACEAWSLSHWSTREVPETFNSAFTEETEAHRGTESGLRTSSSRLQRPRLFLWYFVLHLFFSKTSVHFPILSLVKNQLLKSFLTRAFDCHQSVKAKPDAEPECWAKSWRWPDPTGSPGSPTKTSRPQMRKGQVKTHPNPGSVPGNSPP